LNTSTIRLLFAAIVFQLVRIIIPTTFLFDVVNVFVTAFHLKTCQDVYNFGKMRFPEFSRFSGPKQSFPHNFKLKHNVMNHLSSRFSTFPAELQNIMSTEI